LPPEDLQLAEYTFVSWLRRGLGAWIAEPDDLGAGTATGGGRASLTLELTLGYTPPEGAAAALPAMEKRLEVLGPGDVAGMKPPAVIRTHPKDGAVEVTPGELAYVEFYDEDLPWRYTPARVATAGEPAAGRHKLRPWIALLVLRESEFTLTERPGATPLLTVADGVDLPPVTETWAWAHAQIGRSVATAAAAPAAIEGAPNSALSRLMSPRRLLPGVVYHGFVVPAFEAGRRAALGAALDDVAAQTPSWGAGGAVTLPVFLRWRFTTGLAGDFEALVRRLVARPAGPRFGKRDMAAGDPGFGMEDVAPGLVVGLEGALRPLDFTRQAFPASPGPAYAERLRAVVDLTEDLARPGAGDIPHPLAPTAGRPSGFVPTLREAGAAVDLPDDPILTPPAYGCWHADVARIGDALTTPGLEWLAELNMDPRNRAAAGLGAEVVQARQEELMERAWAQVGRIEDANQRLREAELAAAAGEALFAKHLAAAPGDRVLTLTAAAQHGLAAGAAATPARAVVEDSPVPVAAQSAAFRRIARPQRRPMRRLVGDGTNGPLQGDLLTRMNAAPGAAVSAAPPRAEPGAAVSLSAVSAGVAGAVVAIASEPPEPKQVFMPLVHAELAERLGDGEDLAAADIDDVKGDVGGRLASAFAATPAPGDATLRQRVQDLIDAISGLAPDGPDTAIVTLDADAFEDGFGAVAGKLFSGVTFRPEGAAPAQDEVARATDLGEAQAFQAAVSSFAVVVVAARPLPDPPVPIALGDLASGVLGRMRPGGATSLRVAAALPGVRALRRAPATAPRPMRPVMAYPEFPDPSFESLRGMDQDHILPNVSDLEPDTITLMEPNERFIQSFLAGMNHEMSRELLWREFPTDLRGSYFRVFWDTRDALDAPARTDILPMHEWLGALGGQSGRPSAGIVLVIRGLLLLKYPFPVVYAQEARWRGGNTSAVRELDPAGEVRHPTFTAQLEPDIAIHGFELTEAVARGHRPTQADPDGRPGWFFVIKERPGQIRFGLDEPPDPAEPFETWDDLHWGRLAMGAGVEHIRIAGAAGLAPDDPQGRTWGATSADMAAILFQNPVLYARHAEEMLPRRGSP